MITNEQTNVNDLKTSNGDDQIGKSIQENKKQFLDQVKGKLIVSCQALKDEPLHGSAIMAKMALAAAQGGAAAIRANGREDIIAIKKEVNLPVIGLVKRNYKNYEVYITPTKKEIEELMEAGVDVIALDATKRKRPNGEELEELIEYIQHHGVLAMADISTLQEGMEAVRKGADIISTTISGYTEYTKSDNNGPDIQLVKDLCEHSSIPVIAEGRIKTPEEAVQVLNMGAHAVVVGSAITRPQLITESFTNALKRR